MRQRPVELTIADFGEALARRAPGVERGEGLLGIATVLLNVECRECVDSGARWASSRSPRAIK